MRTLLFLGILVAQPAHASVLQQVVDRDFIPTVTDAAYATGAGPHIAVDEGHFNFHTVGGRYRPFARTLRADGFVVRASTEPFTPVSLAGVDLLVIANALAEGNQRDWSLPNPSAFSPDEIETVHTWVEKGGALLLIADHMPFPGAAEELAAAFGFWLNNGFATEDAVTSPLVFRTADGSLGEHPILDGRSPRERVDSIATFTGEAFRAPPGASILLTLPEGTVSLMPDSAWAFEQNTRVVDVGGWAQGAVLEVGRGRVAVFGEAAMFSAQRRGPERAPMGMNAPVASQNVQFLLNLTRWLVGGPGLP
jgi:hypothetical protein